MFDYDDYKVYIRSVISAENNRGYGKRLAEAAGCQRSYLSSVLHSHNHLTPDHALGLAHFWKMGPKEEDYFLLLVDHERSSTPSLRKRIQRKLAALRSESENLSKRLDRPSLSSFPEESLYYSSWIWSALHIMVSVPSLRTSQALAQKIGLPEAYILECLSALEKMNLVKRTKNIWAHGSTNIHIARDSPLVALNHNNWRQRAVLSAQTRSQGVHFTTVTALNLEARQKIKSLILKLVDDFSTIAGPAPSEEVFCMNLDFFEI